MSDLSALQSAVFHLLLDMDAR